MTKENYTPVRWDEQFKIRIANSDTSMQKHEVVKLLLVMKLIEKNRNHRNWIRIYTEHEINEDIICDIYFEDIKNKVIYAYEIQKNTSSDWTNQTLRKYKDWNVLGFNTSDLIIVPLKNAPDNLIELNKWLNDYIY